MHISRLRRSPLSIRLYMSETWGISFFNSLQIPTAKRQRDGPTIRKQANTSVFTLIPPLPLLQTKPVITMATDSKEAKLDARVEVIVSEGPGKQKQSEDLANGLLLKWQWLNASKHQCCLFKNCVVWAQKQENCVLCLRAWACVSLKGKFTQKLQFCQFLLTRISLKTYDFFLL